MTALVGVDSFPTAVVAGYPVSVGRVLPFGATVVPGGVNFAVYSNHATAVTLVLFEPGGGPIAELPFPDEFRIGGVYAMTVHGLDADTVEYGFRVAGPYAPGAGHRFDDTAVLADPYATLLVGRETWGAPSDPDAPGPRHRSAIAATDFPWDGDRPLRQPVEDLVVYEAHVRGFTRDPSSQVTAPGTFAGLVEKIPYLQRLGVTCVELLPVFEFDEDEKRDLDPTTGERLYDFWGYSPVGFFAPKASYAATSTYRTQLDEFKNLVKQLHRAGISVVLDVVFNHTAEGNERGPTISFRGLDNSTYYMLTPDGWYYNFSGTGNTLNCNNPVVRSFIVDSLRYWASACHVDGFRFDLAAILGRAPDGSLLANPPLLEALAGDPVLRDCLLVAEAWDAGGVYQVGSFPAYQRWAEWNGRYRDGVRSFLKGDPGRAGELATRLVGSPDLYAARGPSASVNFLTAHDGFTLRDLVSYDQKHNEGNGEGNRDGDNNNLSWNCGWEGPTDDPEIGDLRDRQVRNALLLLLCSRGTPMIVAGDEAGRTQGGNNNAYCHDDEVSWFDWTLVDTHADLVEFTRRAIAFRRRHLALRRSAHPDARTGLAGVPEVSWHGERPGEPDWSASSRLVVAELADPEAGDDVVLLAANAHWEPRTVQLPAPPWGSRWHVFADTSGRLVDDPSRAHEPGHEPPLQTDVVIVGPRSTVVLTARPTERKSA